MKPRSPYKTQTFKLSGLQGISDRTLEMHFKLYDGYVKQTNLLSEQLEDILKDGKIDPDETPAYSELNRRMGFEYNGMVLHEYYFGNLKVAADPEPGRTSRFRDLCEEDFGSFEMWKTDFVGVGKMRGVGWAVCYQDPRSLRVSNHWITLHEVGNVSWLRAPSRHGRLGACLPARLPAVRARPVHRRILRQRRLGRSGEASGEGVSPGRVLTPPCATPRTCRRCRRADRSTS